MIILYSVIIGLRKDWKGRLHLASSNYIFLKANQVRSCSERSREITTELIAVLTKIGRVYDCMWLLLGGEGAGVLPYLGYTGRSAAGQGMVFCPHCPKQGIEFDLPLT